MMTIKSHQLLKVNCHATSYYHHMYYPNFYLACTSGFKSREGFTYSIHILFSISISPKIQFYLPSKLSTIS